MAYRLIPFVTIVVGFVMLAVGAVAQQAQPGRIGSDWEQRYLRVTENCARATQLKLEQESAKSR